MVGIFLEVATSSRSGLLLIELLSLLWGEVLT